MLKTFSWKLLFICFAFIFVFISCTKTVKNEGSKIIKKPVEKESKKKKKLFKKIDIVKKGDTIINLLQKQGIDYQTAYKLFSDVKPIFDLRRLNVGMKYSLSFDKDDLIKFQYQIDDNSFLHITNMEKMYKGFIKEIPYKIKEVVVSGQIESSLYGSILNKGENAELADLMASLFEYDVDFNRDLRKGDKYSLLVEKKYLQGVFKGYKRIIAADFTQKERSIKVVLFESPDGKIAYYHPDGAAVKKMFLRSPLPFMRVTSRYGYRKHPVLGYSAKHNGVDLGARRGTKVKVTASGVVIRAGYNRINGKFVEVRHPNKYITQYLHLNGIKKGIRVGVRVMQGQLIGFVGSTGRSTGPHLHYGVKKSNRYMNPLKLKSPKKNPVKKEYRNDFNKYSKRVLQTLYNKDIKLEIKNEIIERLKPVIKPIKIAIGF